MMVDTVLANKDTLDRDVLKHLVEEIADKNNVTLRPEPAVTLLSNYRHTVQGIDDALCSPPAYIARLGDFVCAHVCVFITGYALAPRLPVLALHRMCGSCNPRV